MKKLLIMATTLALGTQAMAVGAMAQTVVKTHSGSVKGVVEGQVVAYKGIPFAQAPVGDLRWRAPQPVAAWKGVKPADHFGPDCMQIPHKSATPTPEPNLSEDCLYLNVWTPAQQAKKKKLPVMVWIYGGGFTNGASSWPASSGTRFAEDGVVLVSFNYRVGRFGFFAHPALTQEAAGAPFGNYGILDQIAALKWVKENAAAFGGDPDNVTIFGVSAGGVSVNALTTTPLANGLFHKAIVQSGGGREWMGRTPTTAQAEAYGVEFARANGVEGHDAKALTALRALPAGPVMNGVTMMSRDFTPLFADGQIVRRAIDAAYKMDEGDRVPMIIGGNDFDALFFGNDLDQAYAPLAPVRAEAKKVYDPEGKANVARIGGDIFADTVFLEPARHIARIVADKGKPVYLYRFAYVPEYLRDKLPGAPHGSETPFVFDTIGLLHGPMTTDKDRAAAQVTHDYWVSFAKTGVPFAANGGVWKPYDPASDKIMVIDASGASERADPFRARLDLVERFTNAAKVAP